MFKFKLWNGENIDYHIGVDKPTLPNEFRDPCCICGKTVYHYDFTAAVKYIHIKCLVENKEMFIGEKPGGKDETLGSREDKETQDR